jgi:uncharacterized membrane protein YoaK (UPF0700 family)
MINDTSQAVKLKVRDMLLSALTVSSGAIDVISFLALGKVFTAFMTGNIVFIGLRVAGASAPDLVSILVSMGSFAAGVYLSTLIIRSSEKGSIWPQKVTVALGTSLIAHALFQVVWFAANGQPTINIVYILLGSWGFAMGMQSAAIRALHVDGVFTTAATATVIFLAADITNWSATTIERRRLTGILLSLLIGATLGGLLYGRLQMYAPLLPFLITVATVTTASIVLQEPARPWRIRVLKNNSLTPIKLNVDSDYDEQDSR